MQTAHITAFTLDRWLPEYFRDTEDQWAAVQARVLTLLLWLYAFGFIPAFIVAAVARWFGFLDTAVPAIIMGLGSVAAMACLLHFRRTANLKHSSRFYAGMALAMVFAVVAYTGGWQSPVCVYLLTLPIVAGFAMDNKSRLSYALMVGLLYSALFLLDRSGYVFVQLIPQSYSLHAQIIIWLAALLTVAACLALFDMTENRLSAMLARDKAELERSANEDALTGAFNDQALFEYMGHQTAEAECSTDSSGQYRSVTQQVVYIIVNNYRDIAQFFGNETADAFLVETAARLRQLLCEGAVLCRYAINEFIVYVPSTMDDRRFARMHNRISALQHKAVTPSDGSRFLLDLRLGVFSCTGARLSPQEIIDHARSAIPEESDHGD